MVARAIFNQTFIFKSVSYFREKSAPAQDDVSFG